MADQVKTFGETSLVDTGTETKIVVGGSTLLTITHSTGAINMNTTGIFTAEEINVNPSVGVSEKFYVEGASRMNGVLKFSEQGSNVNPSGTSEVLIYMKADKLVIAYDHGGTAKYRTLDLTSTDAAWVYSTSAP